MQSGGGEQDETPILSDTSPPPGLTRRRLLRAAGLNLSISDFTAEEQEVRGFIKRRDVPE